MKFLFLSFFYSYLFGWFNFIPIVFSFSLPKDDPNLETRNQMLKDVASKIKNEQRYHQIEENIYRLNMGPIPRNGSLAYQIIGQELHAINKNANPIVPVVYGIVQQASSKLNSSNFHILYQNLSHLMKPPLSSIQADKDEAFAQHRLTFMGFRLKKINHLCTKSKKKLKCQCIQPIRMSSHHVKTICGNSLTKLIDQNRLYTIDLSFVSKYNDLDAPHKHAPSVEGYFCVNNQKKFLPLAIYIHDTKLLYTPFDSSNEWELAKRAFTAAEINVQQFDHFTDTHLILEPIRVELMRHVSVRHPVYVLLNYHFFQIFGNTVAGLKSLLSKNTTFDYTFAWGAKGTSKFLQDVLPSATFKSTFEHRMTKRGLNYIPNYKYRDDARQLIQACQQFLSSYLSSYYKQPQDLKKDLEIQNWAKEASLISNGFPTHFHTLQELIECLSDLIFRTSVHHHALNSNAAWEIISLPNSLPALFYPLPTKKGMDIDLSKYLPPSQLYAPLIASAASFKRPMPLNITLSQSYLNFQFNKTEIQKSIEVYHKQLDNIHQHIEQREKNAVIPFMLLSPKQLPYYVWI